MLDYFADSDEFMAQQLLRMNGLDEEWAELFVDGLQHGLDWQECIDNFELMEDYGIGAEDADEVWALQAEYGLDLEEAIAEFVEDIEGIAEWEAENA